MRLDVVVSGVPSATKGASRIIFFEYIRCLVEYGYEVRCILLLNRSNTNQEVLEFCSMMKSKGTFRAETIEFNDPVFIIERFTVKRNKNVGDLIDSKLLQNPSDIVLFFDIEVASIVNSKFPGKKLIWLGDLYSEVNWSDGMIKAKSGNVINLMRLVSVLLRQRGWKAIYKSVLSDIDKIVVCSYSSIHSLKKLGLKPIFLPYPWPSQKILGVDLPRTPATMPTFLMYGNLKGLGWRSQWSFLFDELYPSAIKEFGVGGFKIDIGGIERAPYDIKERFKGYKELNFLGYIPDLTELMSKAHAVLVPLGVPVGNRSRIITAQASRSLVIAHRNAAVGNPLLVDGYNCLLAESKNEFLRHMKTAFEDAELTSTIIENAYQSYLSSYSPTHACQSLISTINGLKKVR